MKSITRKKWFKRTLLLLCAIVVIAVVAIPIAKANQPRDNDTNAIIYGGAYSIGELKNKLNSGTGQPYQSSVQLTHLYNTLGIEQDQFGKLEDGTVYKNGKVTVGGSTVHTGAHSAGREFMPGSSKDDRFSYPVYWRPTSVSFASDSIPAFVYVNQDGSMAYAIIKSCGNPVKGVGVKIPNHRITVKKYNDLNGDGSRQGTEPWLSGWTFHISGPERDTTGTTNADGEFAFINLKPGSYTITERQKDGWKCTSCKNGNLSVTVTGSTDEIVRFGNQKIEVNPTLYYCGTASDCISTAAYKDTTACQTGVGKPCYKTDSECKATAATNCPVPNPKLYFCSTSTSCESTTNYKDTLACKSSTGKTCYSTEAECKATSSTLCPASSPTLYYCSSSSGCTSTNGYDSTSACQSGTGKPCYTSQSSCTATATTYCPVSRSTFYYCNSSTSCASTQSYDTTTACQSGIGKPCYKTDAECKTTAGTNCPVPNPKLYFCSSSTGCGSTTNFKDTTACQSGTGKPCYASQSACQATTATYCPVEKYQVKVKKYEDLNGSGTHEGKEDWLIGWMIQLRGNNISKDASTNSDGEVIFRNLPAGTYTVREVLQSPWKNITPISQTVTVNQNNKDGYVEFGNQKIPVYPDRFTIVARKYEDANGNAIRDKDELWLQGWKIRLTGDKLTRDFVTNGEGEVTFKDLESGVYTVSEETQGGWKNITPTSQRVNINKENPTSYIEFGNQQIPTTPTTIIQGVTSLPVSGPIEVIAGTLATIGIGSAGVMYRRSRIRLNKSFKKL
ncbi:MAG: SpaA isopeptide-forming pilin-related protein [Patescibacteria group bacterium]|nr:SpaA isopeptide-forming pilin-related protein [Patescibacteria group bacterium]